MINCYKWTTGSSHWSNTDLRQTNVSHLIKLPLHCLFVSLQLPLGVSQPLQVLLVLLLLPLPLLPVLLQLPMLLLDLLLLQRTRTRVNGFIQQPNKRKMAAGSLSIVTSLMTWQYFYHYFEYFVTTGVKAKVKSTCFAHEQLSEISKLINERTILLVWLLIGFFVN